MKKTITLLVLSILILFGIPLIMIGIGGKNAMGYCLTLFYIVNPIFFMIEGILSGYDVSQYWYVPLESAFIYLLSMWILFGMGQMAFLPYMLVYIVIGYIMLTITWFVNNRK